MKSMFVVFTAVAALAIVVASPTPLSAEEKQMANDTIRGCVQESNMNDTEFKEMMFKIQTLSLNLDPKAVIPDRFSVKESKVMRCTFSKLWMKDGEVDCTLFQRFGGLGKVPCEGETEGIKKCLTEDTPDIARCFDDFDRKLHGIDN